MAQKRIKAPTPSTMYNPTHKLAITQLTFLLLLLPSASSSSPRMKSTTELLLRLPLSFKPLTLPQLATSTVSKRTPLPLYQYTLVPPSTFKTNLMTHSPTPQPQSTLVPPSTFKLYLMTHFLPTPHYQTTTLAHSHTHLCTHTLFL